MKKIVIIGAGGHAKVIADIILKRRQLLNENIEIVGFLDDNFENLKDKEIFGYKVLGNLNFLNDLKSKDYLYIIAIGNNQIRKKIVDKNIDINYYTAIHPTAVIANDVEIGKGTVIMANVVINSYSSIGIHCIINTASIVEHDNIIGDYVHISPNVTLCGEVKVEICSWVGAGSNIKQGVSIGENSIVGLGSVVLENVNKNSIVVGVPANIIK